MHDLTGTKSLADIILTVWGEEGIFRQEAGTIADKMTEEQRHKYMSRIRGKNTKPEMIVRKFLFGRGYRYRLNQKKLPGSPDIVLRKYKTVIFVNGCFWHAHEGCRYYVIPKTNVEFWTARFERNMQRDEEDYKALHQLG